VAGVRDGWLAGGQAVLTDREARPVIHVTLLNNTRWIVVVLSLCLSCNCFSSLSAMKY